MADLPRTLRTLALAMPLALIACAPAEDNAAGEEAVAVEEGAPADAASSATAEPAPVEPITMAGTAWAANDNDGAVYTTFIDPDGAYRDFKDGEVWQIGAWDRPGGNRICFKPDNAKEGSDGRLCWTVRPPGEDGVMTAIDEDGREVTVRQVDYLPPEEE